MVEIISVISAITVNTRRINLFVRQTLPTWLKKGNGNPFQYLAWRIPWTQETGGL